METGGKGFWSSDPGKAALGSRFGVVEGLSVKERAVYSSYSLLKDAPLFGTRKATPYNDALEPLKQAKLVRRLITSPEAG